MYHARAILPQAGQRYRLLTRSGMDGLACAVLLSHLGICDECVFVHPKDMQDGIIRPGALDISACLPFVPGIFLAFDHHASETERFEGGFERHVIDTVAKSSARVVYEYFGGPGAFGPGFDAMVDAADKADSGNFSREDIMEAKDWALLSFVADSRTGLGRFHDFEISNTQLMMQLVERLRAQMPIEDILALPDVAARVALYRAHEAPFWEQLLRCSRIDDELVILDLRGEEVVYAGNRFMIYTLYKECNVSIHVIPGKQGQNTVLAVGRSVINRTSDLDVGRLLLSYGGGGHPTSGTCQVDVEDADWVLTELRTQIKGAAGLRL